MLQWCMWRSSKVIGNDNIRYNAHEFVIGLPLQWRSYRCHIPQRPQKHFGYILSPKIVSGSNDFGSFFFLLSNISMKAKSYTWYYITNRQRQNAASLTPIPQTQWLLSPKSRVKIGLIPPFLKLPLPYFPQLPSKIYLDKTQMSKCTMRIDVTITRIVSNKFALHGIQRKQTMKYMKHWSTQYKITTINSILKH